MDQPERRHAAAMHLLTPFVAMGATMVLRKALNAGYHRITGSPPPSATDGNITFRRALIWAMTTAATAAVVEVAIYRIMEKDPAD
jgi:hypothetical protein